MREKFYILILSILTFLSACVDKNKEIVRKTISLNTDWKTIVAKDKTEDDTLFVRHLSIDDTWKAVSVPHNWDQYYGYRRMKHGNLHGTAWYSRTLTLDKSDSGKQHFLFFEGVGSYATVWVNGKHVGEHKGGRTTFTLDITNAIDFNIENTILVKADHPEFITDLPWVCGGCSGEWGFSEGSQPLGIFRPVSLVVTDKLRIEPFGVHIWNDDKTSKENAMLHVNTELKNYGEASKNITITNTLLDESGKEVVSVSSEVKNLSGLKTIAQTLPEFENPKLWSPKSPYLYQLVTTIYNAGKAVDRLITPYGIRWLSWPVNRAGDDHRFFVNDEPVFVNGTCEYEHLIGRSHAFTAQDIKTRVAQVKAAGYNAFREGHQPHNLRYQNHFDKEGILFWSQFSAHIWYDTPAFKKHFKTLLKEWVKERRNNPSVVMWGLQNESTIPKAFAEECTKIIRELDPTAALQRKVTTCNGGEGTDWNVIQNWSGTYGGDPFNYDNELADKLLNGEYGAWRTADLHTEGSFNQKGALSENRFSQLMEIKLREAQSVSNKVAGQYHWLLYSHENPGRSQNGEGYKDIDRVGPVNYKGIFAIWGEPLDAFYMYRSNYVSNKTNPMVYIVSHSWPNRWDKPGVKHGIEVYSNCDAVELFNDVNHESLGRLKHLGIGKHFQWDNVNIKYNVLYVVGYVEGKPVTKDYIVLNNLPKAPHFDALVSDTNILKPSDDYNYIYRVNSGGPDYTDTHGNVWLADVHKTDTNTWGSTSWTDDFEKLPAFYASKRRTNDPIAGTKDWNLFQDFRYGADKLQYEFPVPEGEYLVELFFTEPWYGTGGSMNCEGWRVFDVAINNKTVLTDFDIWSEISHDTALKKTFTIKSKNGKIKVAFPKVASGQAVISAIAIATKDKTVTPAKASAKNILGVKTASPFKIESWLSDHHKQYLDSNIQFTHLPSEVYAADYLRFPDSKGKTDVSGTFISKEEATVYVFSNKASLWLSTYEKTTDSVLNSAGEQFHVYKKTVKKGEQVTFGDQSDSKYTIAVVPVYEMKEQNNRPVLKLEAEQAVTTGAGVEKGFFKKSDYVAFTQQTDNSITFTVNPGVANIYLMRYRFMNINDKPIKVRLTIEDANGILLRNDDIVFPVKDKKWKILNTSSEGYINAGTYKIKISANDMKGLRIESFEFQ